MRVDQTLVSSCQENEQMLQSRQNNTPSRQWLQTRWGRTFPLPFPLRKLGAIWGRKDVNIA